MKALFTHEKSGILYPLISLVFGVLMIGVTLFATTDTRALDCDGFSISDEDARFIADNRLAGQEYRVTGRKTLVINSIESVTGSDCEIVIEANVTLKRRIRRDAHGTMRLEGQLALADGSLCIVAGRVTDFSLSNTLFIGEFFYRLFAGSINECLL